MNSGQFVIINPWTSIFRGHFGKAKFRIPFTLHHHLGVRFPPPTSTGGKFGHRPSSCSLLRWPKTVDRSNWALAQWAAPSLLGCNLAQCQRPHDEPPKNNGETRHLWGNKLSLYFALCQREVFFSSNVKIYLKKKKLRWWGGVTLGQYGEWRIDVGSNIEATGLTFSPKRISTADRHLKESQSWPIKRSQKSWLFFCMFQAS